MIDTREARERRLSPLDGRCLALGGVFGEKNGWERVLYFESGGCGRRAGADQRAWGWKRPGFFDRVGEEHRAVRERAGILDTLGAPGLVQSEQMRTEERFVPDGDRMRVVVQHYDPVYYTKLVVTYPYQRLPDGEILPWDCTPEKASYQRFPVRDK